MRKRTRSLIFTGAILITAFVALAYAGWNRLLMTRGKDPGLSIQRLHAQGIDGRGISVAIIDGQIRTDHAEYRDQIAYYEELSDFDGIPFEAHGPSVASILAGKLSGVAPGVNLYYFAQNFARTTPADTAEALRHILSLNEDLPDGQRIRVVSISNGWPDQDGGIKEFNTAIRESWRSGVFVINSQYPTLTQPPLSIRGVGCPPWKDRDDPLNYGLPAAAKADLRTRNLTVEEYLESRVRVDREKGYVSLFVPVDYRTLAGPGEGEGVQTYGPESYYYEAEGGDSWWPPYISGVLALALQVNPGLTPDEMVGLLADGVYNPGNGISLIAPEKIVQLARKDLSN